MSGVTPQVTELPNADEIARTIARIAYRIIEKTVLGNPNVGCAVPLGTPSDGVPLAGKLANLIEQFSSIRPEVGLLDITLYRDDLRKGPYHALQPTNIPNSGIDGTAVVLIGDVLFSGHTTRVVPDAITDIGHPRVIQLIVLVDRGHRRPSICADYVSKDLPTSRDEDTDVLVEALDGRDVVILTRVEEQ